MSRGESQEPDQEFTPTPGRRTNLFTPTSFAFERLKMAQTGSPGKPKKTIAQMTA